MNATEARAHADALRIKALALYAEAREISKGKTWVSSVRDAQQAKLAEARTADNAYNSAVFLAMRLEAEERRRGREA